MVKGTVLTEQKYMSNKVLGSPKLFHALYSNLKCQTEVKSQPYFMVSNPTWRLIVI